MAEIDKSFYLAPVELDGANGFIRPLVAHEGDVAGRGIALTVTLNGKPLNLTDKEVILEWANGRSSGSRSFEAVDASKGHFTVAYPKAMQRPGRATCRIAVKESEEFITGSQNFFVDVQAAPVSDEQIKDSPDYSVLGQLIAQVEGISEAEQIRAQAESARAAAELSRQASEEARRTNFTNVLSSTATATTAANSAAGNANAAATEAWTAAAAAESAAGSAEEAAQRANDAAEAAESATTVLDFVDDDIAIEALREMLGASDDSD